ncbi:MAG: CaiB/BaiF CoA transferase family protein, partial [Acidimicrobiales bacterium]
ASAGAARGPLAGLAVLALSWSVAGPYVGRGLVDFGAEVVRVETRTRPDVSRTASPFHPRNEDHPLEGSGLYHNSNAGKLGVELDLAAPPAREVLWDLIRWADVILESFSAGAFERMGFSWERISELNPRAVLLSSCLPGQTGELHLPGYGNLSTALFGFTTVTRWPGRPAAGPFGAYTDIVSPRFGLAAVLAALDHRRRSGRGQHLDLSQAEASLHFLAPALLDAEVNDAPFEARGNHDPDHAPHGVYPCAGEDRWAAVVCTTDEQWRALAALLGREDLADLGRAERLARQDELDALVGAWTSARSAEAAQEILVAAGVAAHQVQNSPECLADPQLAHRGHYVTVEHPLLGPVVVEGPRVRLLGTPGATTAPGPTYGQHSDYVLRELLGYSDERIAELVVAGALG